MPVAEGSVEGKPVNVLRDTGCTTVVVRRSLVPDYKLTGQEEQCILTDGAGGKDLYSDTILFWFNHCHLLGEPDV